MAYIRWHYGARKHGGRTLCCTICENHRVPGKLYPVQSFIANLASIRESDLDNPAARAAFWEKITKRLAIYDGTTRAKYEDAIERRVPKLSLSELALLSAQTSPPTHLQLAPPQLELVRTLQELLDAGATPDELKRRWQHYPNLVEDISQLRQRLAKLEARLNKSAAERLNDLPESLPWNLT